MTKPLDILFVASEAEPFVKAGGLADLAANIPKSVKTLGHEIRVMLPGYGFINERRHHLHHRLRMKDIEVPIGDISEVAYVKSSFLNCENKKVQEVAYVKSSYLNCENKKVQVYFLSNDRYFNREGLYCHPDTKQYFADNDERFIFFCRAVLETLKRLGWKPRIIHCNDWQCGLIPMYLKTIYKDDSFFRGTRTVFTAYSLASHGIFPKSSVVKTGLPPELFLDGGDHGSKLNFLQAGLTYADVITTLGVRADKKLAGSGAHGDLTAHIVAMTRFVTGQEITEICGAIADHP